MLRNIAIAWRGLLRDRQFSLLNIAGLTTGLTCALLIFLWVADERSIDHFNNNDERLFQVIKNANNGDGTVQTHESTPAILAASMKNDFPEIKQAVTVRKEQPYIVRSGSKSLKTTAYYASSDFFNVFSYRIVEGTATNALTDPSGVYISDRTANALFNQTENVIGKVIEWITGDEMEGTYTVAGVFASPPRNATDQFDIVLSFDKYYSTFRTKYGLDKWYSNNPHTYIVLKDGVDAAAFNNKIKDYSRQKMNEAEGPEGAKWEHDTFIQRYSEKYLNNQYENGKIAGGRIAYVRLFTLIAIVILVLACINFMNLSTAQAEGRIKDAGIRKLIGASRISLIFKFIGQSTFLAFISGVVAIGLLYLLLPHFSTLTGKFLTLNIDARSLGAFVAIILITGVVAGSYPAVYLSSFKPLRVIKSNIHVTGGNATFRKSLVVFQFTLSVIFITGVIIIYKQMRLVQSKNLGFEKNNIITFTTEGRVQENIPSFFAELKKIPGVEHVTGMQGNMIGQHSGGGGINWEGKGEKAIEFDGFYVNNGWTETFSIPVVTGKSFTGVNDSMSVLFNETAIRMMGIKDPIGKKITMWGKDRYITGIVRDFHYESLYNRPGPMFIAYEAVNPLIAVKLAHAKVPETIERIKRFYSSFNGGLPFDYHFIDEDFDKLYSSENRVSTLSKYFAGLAILISCLGLLGLSAYTVQKRRKEIGIRKVLGATVSQLTLLLSSSFFRLIIIALLVAFPIAWWLLNEWLNAFAYRVDIGVDIFVYSAVIVLAITACTVSVQAIRSAITNPVKSLHVE